MTEIQSPPPPETQSPSPDDAAGSSTPSEKGSPSSAAGGLVANAGPAFDPRTADAAAPALEEPALIEIAWDPERVKVVLRAEGTVAHAIFAVDKASSEWKWTESELATVAPALANMLNASDATRAAAASSDPLAVIMGLSAHVGRSIGERRAAIAAQQSPEPITGLTPDPLTPQPDEEPQWTLSE